MANEVAVLPKKELIEQVEGKLTDLITEKIKAFPKDFNETRFIQNCITVLQETKDIEKCKPLSVVRTMVKGAYLGLDFFRRECYGIPYDVNVGTKDHPQYEKQLQFQTDYKGEIKLAKKYGKNILDIYAKVVQEGDALEIKVENGKQSLDFVPKPFNDGKIIGAFAVVLFEDGTMKYDTMSVKDIEDTRSKYSKAANGPGWIKSWPEMAKKTVLRRVCKLVDLDFDSQEQQKAYEEGGDADLHDGDSQPPAKTVDDPFNKKQEPKANGTQEAEIVKPEDPDAELRAKLTREHAGEESWQIDARIKEIKEAKNG
jgi:recombination protein RecT